MINHIESECSKLSQKVYKARHNWRGEVIHWESCKRLDFDICTKQNLSERMRHIKFDEISKIRSDFLITPGRPDRVLIDDKQKGTCCLVYFAVSTNHRVKIIDCEKRHRQKLEPSKRIFKKWVKYESKGHINCNWCTWNSLQSFWKGEQMIGKSEVETQIHPDYCIL